MKSRNVKVIDEHNIDRNANVVFAIELDGSEYVVYWIERDEESNNLFVSKVLKNIDGTYNMLNIDDEDKKKEISDIVKTLVSTSVTDQNDKMNGTMTTLSNGVVVKFVDVLFNKEQYINVPKTYITTVKKEVTKVAENYYDVVVEEAKVEDVLTSVTPVTETVNEIFPQPVMPTVVTEPVVAPVAETPVVVAPVVETPVLVTPTVEVVPIAPVSVPVQEVVTQTVPQVAPTVVEPVSVVHPVEAPTPVVNPTPFTSETVQPAVVIPTPVVSAPVVTPTVETTAAVASVPVTNQTLVFNAAKETNLNAALGEVANSTTIPVDNITPVREFGQDAPVAAPVVETPVVSALVVQSVGNTENGTQATPVTPVSPKAGFANSKFFMVVAVAFFLASCIFLGYEVYNYFQLVQ